MEKLDDGAELVLGLIRQDFFCAIANVGTDHSPYASTSEAMMAMLREAYQAGVKSQQPPADFDADVARAKDSHFILQPEEDGIVKL